MENSPVRFAVLCCNWQRIKSTCVRSLVESRNHATRVEEQEENLCPSFCRDVSVLSATLTTGGSEKAPSALSHPYNRCSVTSVWSWMLECGRRKEEVAERKKKGETWKVEEGSGRTEGGGGRHRLGGSFI